MVTTKISERITNVIYNYYANHENIPNFLILDMGTYKRLEKELNESIIAGQAKKAITSYKGLRICVLKEKVRNFIKCS